MTSKEAVEAAKQQVEIEKIHRRAQLAKWSDYIGFFTLQICASLLLVLGILGIINPSWVPHTQHPETLFGGGLALLTGKGVLSVLAKISKTLG